MDLSTLSILVGRFLFVAGCSPDGPGLARPVDVVARVDADEGAGKGASEGVVSVGADEGGGDGIGEGGGGGVGGVGTDVMSGVGTGVVTGDGMSGVGTGVGTGAGTGEDISGVGTVAVTGVGAVVDVVGGVGEEIYGMCTGVRTGVSTGTDTGVGVCCDDEPISHDSRRTGGFTAALPPITLWISTYHLK